MAQFIHSCQKAQYLFLVQSYQNKCLYIFWFGFWQNQLLKARVYTDVFYFIDCSQAFGLQSNTDSIQEQDFWGEDQKANHDCLPITLEYAWVPQLKIGSPNRLYFEWHFLVIQNASVIHFMLSQKIMDILLLKIMDIPLQSFRTSLLLKCWSGNGRTRELCDQNFLYSWFKMYLINRYNLHEILFNVFSFLQFWGWGGAKTKQGRNCNAHHIDSHKKPQSASDF